MKAEILVNTTIILRIILLRWFFIIKVMISAKTYTVDIPITGPNGNTVNVRTGWIIKTGSDVPELTTIFVKD